MSAPELRDEVAGLAQELIRLDTSNPPGNKTPAAEHLAVGELRGDVLYGRGAGDMKGELAARAVALAVLRRGARGQRGAGRRGRDGRVSGAERPLLDHRCAGGV